MSEINGNDLKDIVKDALVGVLSATTKEERAEYVQWAEEMAPVITLYATRAAQGDPKAGEILAHVRAQAEAKLWILAIEEDSASQSSAGAMAEAVAVTVGKILGSLVSKYGLLLLGI